MLLGSRLRRYLLPPVIFLGTLSLASAQSFQWARRLGGTQSAVDDEAHGVAAGPGGVYVVGVTSGSFPGQTGAGAKDAVVVKFDPAGTQLWIRQFGTSAEDVLNAATADSTGVYVAGTTQGALAGRVGGSDAFVRKYDPNGNELWTRQFGTSTDDEALGIASDGTGVYVVGNTQGALTGGAFSGGDAFIRKYDSSGNEV